MTRPIYEPTPTRKDAYLDFQGQQLFRRPAPTSATGATLPYIWMSWSGPRAVTVDTISNPATMGSPDIPYDLLCSYDPDNIAGWSWNEATGCIGFLFPGNYLITGWAAFDGGATPGSVLGVCLEQGTSCSFSSTGRLGNIIVATTVIDSWRIPFVTEFWEPTQVDRSFRLMVYHNDAGGQDLNTAFIHITQLNPNIDCTDAIP